MRFHMSTTVFREMTKLNTKTHQAHRSLMHFQAQGVHTHLRYVSYSSLLSMEVLSASRY